MSRIAALKPAAAVLAVALVAAVAGEASAHPTTTHERVDRLAFRLERRTRDVQGEVNDHFRDTPRYRHLADDVADMVRLAHHVHRVAHDGGTLHHLRADVQRLDRLFHHVEDEVDRLAATHEAGRRAIRHIREALAEMHGAIRDLRHELR
jgi:hypothetical protein